ncbi:hypothetical protein G9C98_003949 [Cotesia typhae]|uniref:Uncharacterized protein n=1 Tax=Cotesia typhae TaxID=2053667 RepID=A0A8J5QV31_9HYME|nr:hypothetical protein G9C98_003949 [Cotesia typhae]
MTIKETMRCCNIEEEAACISTDHDDLSEQPYDGEHEGFNSVNELDTPVENDVRVEEETNTEDDDDDDDDDDDEAA